MSDNLQQPIGNQNVEFTKEQTEAIDSQLQKKLSASPAPIFYSDTVSDGISQQTKNYIRGNTRDVWKDAAISLPVLDENSTDEEKKKYEELSSVKANARGALAFAEYNVNTDKSKQKQFEELSRFYGANVSSNDADIVQRLMSQKLMNDWVKTFDEYGLPDSSIINNAKIRSNFDPETYKYFKTAQQVQQDSKLFSDLRRSFALNTELRNLNNEKINDAVDSLSSSEYIGYLSDTLHGRNTQLNSTNKGMSNEEYEERKAQIIDRYSRDTDGIKQSLYDLFSDMRYSLGGLNLVDDYRQARRREMEEIIKNNPNITDKELALALHNSNSGSNSVILNALSIMLFKGAGEYTKILGQATAKTLSKLGVDVSARVPKVAQQVLGHTSNIAINTAQNTAFSKIDDANVKYNARVDVGQSQLESLAQIPSDLVSDLGETVTQSALVSAFFESLPLLNRARAKVLNLKKQANARVADEVVSNSPLTKNDPATSAEIYDELQSRGSDKIYLDKDAVTDVINRADQVEKSGDTVGVNRAVLGDEFNEAYDRAQHGNMIEITRGQWAKLPQEVRDELIDYTTTENGAPLIRELSATLSDKKIEEIKNDIADKVQQRIKREEEMRPIQQELNRVLADNSKNTTVEENNVLSKGVTTFLRSMSDITGVDVSTLWNKFKPLIKHEKGVDFSKVKNANKRNERGVLGVIDDVPVIKLNSESTFTDVLHEQSHWFLHTMRELSKENKEVHDRLDKLVKWWDSTKSLDTLSKEDWDKLQEQFVARFIADTIGNKKSDSSVLNNFKKMLSHNKNNELFNKENLENFDKKTITEKAFKQNYGEELNQGTKDFNDFVDSLFESEQLYKEQIEQYPIDDLLGDIDSSPLPDEAKQLFKDTVKSDLINHHAALKGLIDELAIKKFLIGLVNGRSLDKLKRQIIKKNMAKLPREDLEKQLVALDNLAKKYEKVKEEQKQLLKNDPRTIYIEDLKTLPISLKDKNVPKYIEDKLKAKKIVDNDTGIEVREILDDYDRLPQQWKDAIDSAKDKEQALLECIANYSIENEAKRIAYKAVLDKAIKKTQLEGELKISKKISSIHRQLGTQILKALKAITKTGENAKKILFNIKKIAQNDVDQLAFSDLSVSSARRLAARANQKVKVSLARGELREAEKQTRNELYQNEKAEYIADTIHYVEKKMADFKDLASRNVKRVGKSYDPNLMDLLRIVTDTIGLTERKANGFTIGDIAEIKERILNESDYLDSLGEEQALIERAKIEAFCNRVADVANDYYANRTVSKLYDLIEFMSALKDYARKTKTFCDGEKTIEFKDAQEQLVKTTSDLKTKKASLNGASQGKSKGIFGAFNSLRKKYAFQAEHTVERYDGKKLGAWHELIYAPIERGYTQMKLALRDITSKLGDSLSKIKIDSREIQTDLIIKNETTGKNERLVLGSRSGHFNGRTTLEILGLLLHCGTNYEKLVKGYVADPEIGAKFKDGTEVNLNNDKSVYAWKQEQFNSMIQSLCDQGFITKELLNCCKEIWGTFKELDPKVMKATREQNGYGFKRLDGQPLSFKLADGSEVSVDAGYVPAILNNDRAVTKASENGIDITATGAMQNQMSVMGLKTPSFIKERNQKAFHALDLDPVHIISGIEQELKFIYLTPRVNEVNKLLHSKAVANEIERIDPGALKERFEPWIKTLATGQDITPASSNKFIQWISRKMQDTGLSIMAGYIKNAGEQFFDLAPVMYEVGFTNTMKGIVMATMYHNKLKAEICKNSAYMNSRLNESNNSINEIFKRIQLNPFQYTSNGQKLKAGAQWIQNFSRENAMFAQVYTQRFIDEITWYGAQQKYLHDHPEQTNLTESVKYADSVVRTVLGSYDRPDTALIAKSNAWYKLFTTFTSYFINKMNLLSTRLAKNSREFQNSNKRFSDYMNRYGHDVFAISFFTLLPSLLSELLTQTVNGSLTSDDDDEFRAGLWNVALSPTKFVASGKAPLMSNMVVSPLVDMAVGKQYFSSAYMNSPLLTTGTAFLHSGVNVYNASVNGGELKSSDVRNIMMGTSTLLGVPFIGTASRPVHHAVELSNREVEPADNYFIEAWKFIHGR